MTMLGMVLMVTMTMFMASSITFILGDNVALGACGNVSDEDDEGLNEGRHRQCVANHGIHGNRCNSLSCGGCCCRLVAHLHHYCLSLVL